MIIHDDTPNSSNSWGIYFARKELIAEIQLDLNRLYPNGIPIDFFQKKEYQNILLHVLYTWACMYPDTSYRQVG